MQQARHLIGSVAKQAAADSVINAEVNSRTGTDRGPRSCGVINKHSPLANGM